MKSFARRNRARRAEALDLESAEGVLDAADLDIAPLGITGRPTPEAPDSADASIDPLAAEAADFAARLGDLDRFIGGGTTAAASVSTSWTGGSPARNLPAAPIPAVAPISHPRPAEPAPPTVAAPQPADALANEAAEFVERLGDLDRFIGGAAPAPAPAPNVAPAAADADAEAQDFLDRLSDLDRFIGGGGTPAS